jgi:hypothetical protein
MMARPLIRHPEVAAHAASKDAAGACGPSSFETPRDQIGGRTSERRRRRFRERDVKQRRDRLVIASGSEAIQRFVSYAGLKGLLDCVFAIAARNDNVLSRSLIFA